jgi:hypothetical protein
MIMSRHAEIRARQRGISAAQLSAVFIHADREIRRGKSCYAIWISKNVLRRLGPITPEGVSTDRLKKLTVLQSEDETCVTAFRSQRGKAYRRRTRRARHTATKLRYAETARGDRGFEASTILQLIHHTRS